MPEHPTQSNCWPSSVFLQNRPSTPQTPFLHLFSLILFSLLLFQAGGAHGQSKTAPFKTTKRIYATNGLTVDAEISVSPKPTGGLVKIKYIYNGPIAVQEAHANWKMSFLNENDQLVIKQLTVPIGGSELQGTVDSKSAAAVSVVDAPFPCLQVVNPCFDIKVGPTAIKSRDIVSTNAIQPDSIGGPSALQPGQGATLRVVGGSLPQGSSWVWYEGQCDGTRIGKGRTLVISPRGSTTYFVKAEPGTTPCLTTTVRVDNRSVAPQGISGPTTLCNGESLSLMVVGGALGVDAEWVWYNGACGSTKLGRGRTFTTTAQTKGTASSTTTYFVRAEGKFNTTDCAKQAVEVTGNSEGPSAIGAAGPTQFCEGSTTPLLLKVVGGKLAPGAHWAWYAGVCSGRPLGLGETFSVSPDASTVYLVRAEGTCTPSASASLAIQVRSKSQAPQSIAGPMNVTRNEPFVLQVQGGQLGENAQWKWYANDCSKGKLLGSGTSLTLKLRKPTLVFVKAVGPCGETECTSKAVVAGSARSWEHAFQAQKFLHFGVGFGLDYQHASILTGRQTTNRTNGIVRSDTMRSEADAFGVLGEFTFHPIIKNGFSLGLRSSAALGTGIYSLLSAGSPEGNKRFSYYEFKAGGEMAIGARRFKVLITQEHRLREYRFENQSGEWKINQRNKSYLMKLGVGTRIGAYGREKKAANTVDLLGFLTHSTPSLNAQTMYSGVANWNVGAGLNWWCHNKVGLRLEATLQEVQGRYNPLATSLYGAQFNASLVLKEDFFR